MLFNSIHFLIFFPIVLLAFFIVPKKLRCPVLLIASYYFYMSWNPVYALLIGFSTVSTYLAGLVMKYAIKRERKKLKIAALATTIVINLAILFL
jgi:D-alanyl-lipoteichoic acid acyltransferase DltB (MBOAT superfamily)